MDATDALIFLGSWKQVMSKVRLGLKVAKQTRGSVLSQSPDQLNQVNVNVASSAMPEWSDVDSNDWKDAVVLDGWSDTEKGWKEAVAATLIPQVVQGLHRQPEIHKPRPTSKAIAADGGWVASFGHRYLPQALPHFSRRQKTRKERKRACPYAHTHTRVRAHTRARTHGLSSSMRMCQSVVSHPSVWKHADQTKERKSPV